MKVGDRVVEKETGDVGTITGPYKYDSDYAACYRAKRWWVFWDKQSEELHIEESQIRPYVKETQVISIPELLSIVTKTLERGGTVIHRSELFPEN